MKISNDPGSVPLRLVITILCQVSGMATPENGFTMMASLILPPTSKMERTAFALLVNIFLGTTACVITTNGPILTLVA